MYVLSHQNFEAKPVTTTGEAIAKRLAQKLQDERAVLAVSLVNGTPIHRKSRRQAAKLANVSRHKIRVAELATPDEIELLKLGRLRLSDVRATHTHPRKLSDAEVLAIVNRIGADRIWSVIDQMTAPEPTTAIDPVITQLAMAAE